MPRKEKGKNGDKGGGKDQDHLKSWWTRKDRTRGRGGFGQNGDKGGGKDQDHFKSWWSRKERTRGQGCFDQKINGKDKGKGKNIKGKGSKGKTQ